MSRISSMLIVVGLAAAGLSTQALAENPLGLYVGAGVGESTVGNDYYYPYGYGGGFHDHDAAWKVLVGIRPLPIVGAEFEYIDFGQAGGDNGYYSNYYDENANSHPKATVLYGLAYLPLPLPFIDVYGKLGVAHLQTDDTVYNYSCSPGLVSSCPLVTETRFDQQNTRFAYGAGVQAKFQDFALRGEYERISSPYGDPGALMFSLTWTF
jgi:opacity protein-like surface antigen